MDEELKRLRIFMGDTIESGRLPQDWEGKIGDIEVYRCSDVDPILARARLRSRRRTMAEELKRIRLTEQGLEAERTRCVLHPDALFTVEVYRCSDVDPLIDRLNRLLQEYGDGGLDGPSLQGFMEWRDERDAARSEAESALRSATRLASRLEEAEQALSDAQDEAARLREARAAFIDYVQSEGCSCCRDDATHSAAEDRLARAFGAKRYDDGSGWDWTALAREEDR